MERRANGEGTIKKRDDGYFAVSLSDGKDANGNRVRHQATCKTKKEALAKLEAWKAAKRGGVDLKKANMTMSALVALWLENCRPRLRASTMFYYEQLAHSYLLPELGDKKVVQVDAMMLDDFFKKLRTTKQKEKVLGPRTIGSLRRVLHTIFDQARKYKIVQGNPVEDTAAIEASSFEAGFMTEEQARALVAVLPNNDYGLFVLLSVFTGMRPAEVRGLRWSDSDSDVELLDGGDGGAVLHIRRQLRDLRGKEARKKAESRYDSPPPKTGSGKRQIPLPASVAKRLIEHRRQRDAARAEARAAGLAATFPAEWADLVFQGEAGLPLNERYIRRKYKEFLKAAGLDEGLRLYDCRHSFNAILSARGESAETRKDLMGHSTTKLVDNEYSHVMPSSRVAAMSKMGHLLPEEE